MLDWLGFLEDAALSNTQSILTNLGQSNYKTISDAHMSVLFQGVGEDLSCASPIENLFLFGLHVRCEWEHMPHCFHEPIPNGEIGALRAISCIHPRRPLTIFPQQGVAGYRPDFVLAWPEKVGVPSRVRLLAVECDGHEFHEKTKAQAERDKSRDRKIVGTGIPIMRFTGSELFRAPVACGGEVLASFLQHRTRIENEEMEETAKRLAAGDVAAA